MSPKDVQIPKTCEDVLYMAEGTLQKHYNCAHTWILAYETHFCGVNHSSRIQLSGGKRRGWDGGGEMRQLGPDHKDWEHHAEDPSQATFFPLAKEGRAFLLQPRSPLTFPA